MSDDLTIELRKKLDEMNIKHLDYDFSDNDKETRWWRNPNGWGMCYVEHNPSVHTLRIYDCAPEEAVAVIMALDAFDFWKKTLDAIKEDQDGCLR